MHISISLVVQREAFFLSVSTSFAISFCFFGEPFPGGGRCSREKKYCKIFACSSLIHVLNGTIFCLFL